MFFSLSFLLIFLFSSNNAVNAHETHPHPHDGDHRHDDEVDPKGAYINMHAGPAPKDKRHVGWDHDALGHHVPISTTVPPTTTTPGPDEEGCDLNPCLPQCNTCQRDGVCSLSCQSEYGYKCVSPTGSLGKNTSFAPPIITCKLHEIDISVIDTFFEQTDFVSDYFYISKMLDDREKCRVEPQPDGGRRTWSTFFIDTRTSSHCMEKFVNDGDVQYSSILWADLQGNGFDMPVPIIKFRCEYRTDYYIGTEMKPMVAQTTTIVEDGNRLDLKIELCKQSTCSGDCPEALKVNGQAIYTIGQRIYIGIKSIGHENTVVHGHTMSLQDVYLSCSINPESSSRRVQLFDDGCVGNGVSSLFATPGDLNVHRACFSFILARLLDCRDHFYIHAYVSLCNRANRLCSDGTMTCPAPRGKRSAAQDESGPLVIGPVYMMDSERVAQPSFWVLPSGQAPGDAVEDPGETITLRTSRLSSEENSDHQFGAVEMVKQEGVGSSPIDVVLIVGISLLVFSLLLFSFSFYQFRSRYSSIVDDLKK